LSTALTSVAQRRSKQVVRSANCIEGRVKTVREIRVQRSSGDATLGNRGELGLLE